MFEFNFFNFNINIDLSKILALFKNQKNKAKTTDNNMSSSSIEYISESSKSAINIGPGNTSQTKSTLIRTGSGTITLTGKASVTQTN